MNGKLHAIVIGIVALAVALATPALAAEQVTVTGEVIDSACYIKMGAKGEGHAECAKKCGEAGIPLALLEDGTEQVIWLAASEDRVSANDALIPYAGKKVTVTGTYAERGGAKVLVMESVQPAS